MLLLEIKERFQRHGVYGHWIDPDNNFHPVVDEAGHYDWLIEHLYNPASVREQIMMQKAGRIELFAFKRGYIRLVHKDPGNIGIEGIQEHLRRAIPVLRPTFSQEDVNEIHFDIYDGDFHSFVLPQQRAKLTDFANNL